MLDIEDFRKKIKEKSRLMGIDPGKARVGISLCDENRKIATPYKTLEIKDFASFLKQLVTIINENNIEVKNNTKVVNAGLAIEKSG